MIKYCLNDINVLPASKLIGEVFRGKTSLLLDVRYNCRSGPLHLKLRLATVLILSAASIGKATAAPDVNQCAIVLQPALKTLINSGKIQSNSDAYTTFQCSEEFNTHDDAIKSGISVGFPVYGIPVKVGGTFDRTETENWKKNNCSSSSRQTSADAATSFFLSQLAPEVVPAWSKCIHDLGGREALDCEMQSSTPPIFKARWLRTSGASATEAPKVTRFSVVNGTCSSAFMSGQVISDGGEGVSCTPDKRQGLAVLLNTNRGFCSASTTPTETVFRVSAIMALDADKTIQSDIVEFEPGSMLITNGHYLGIKAEEIRLTGDAQIVSFRGARPNRSLGDAGQSGGSVILQADRVTGSRLVIDLRGEDGMKGMMGSPGEAGSKGSPSAHAVNGGTRGCINGVNAGRGGTGGTGGTGGQGGAGGSGGSVIVRIASGVTDGALSRISVSATNGRTNPGSSGSGGDPGPGGPAGLGGDPSGGGPTCGSKPTGPAGTVGQPGQAGKAGASGAAGTISAE